jgi:hypothetical protein
MGHKTSKSRHDPPAAKKRFALAGGLMYRRNYPEKRITGLPSTEQPARAAPFSTFDDGFTFALFVKALQTCRCNSPEYS